MEWWSTQLLPNIPPQSVIVLNRAPYHNLQKDKPPTKSNTKAVMKQWLDHHNIEYESTVLKRDLFKRIQDQHQHSLFLTDQAAQENGHTALRLPVAHCELNPIELAWASVKGFVARQNQHFRLADVEKLTPQGLEHTTPEMWNNFCKHVIKLENSYFENDVIVEEAIEEFAIELLPEDSESDEEIDDEALIDFDDKDLIDHALHLLQSPIADNSNDKEQDRQQCTSRQNLLARMDKSFLDSVLPLP